MKTILAASFRDPSGFIFEKEGEIFRQINICYKENYEELKASGLYEELTKAEMLIKHIEVDDFYIKNKFEYKTIKPEKVNFISYPYEWCFSQFKDAALLTLEIQKKAIKRGMILKDASAYNIQFLKGRPIFIDTLSFEHYEEGKPWEAYRQFCQHFLAPLALMSMVDCRFNQMMKIYIDGIPINMAAKMLKSKAKFNFGIWMHIKMHSRFDEDINGTINKKKIKKFINKNELLGIIDTLENTIKRINIKIKNSEWGNYYNNTNYSEKGIVNKKAIIEEYIKKVNPKEVWDIGANTGLFSRIASNMNINTISFDYDYLAVEKNYRNMVNIGEKNILPLLMDIFNPSPNIGWDTKERLSLFNRGNPDMMMALALIHHIAISNNVPLDIISSFFAKKTKWLIIEFIPKEDSQVIYMLSSRKDIFNGYCIENFEIEFEKNFEIIRKEKVIESSRVIYLMRRKEYA